MSNSHLAILKKPYLDMILSGQKTVESRLTKTRRAPFGHIAKGDKVFFKISSGPVCAVASVHSVRQYKNLTSKKIIQLKNQYNNLILGADSYWKEKKHSRYAVLVWLADVRDTKPIKIDKKDWRAWIVLSEANDYGLGKIRC